MEGRGGGRLGIKIQRGTSIWREEPFSHLVGRTWLPEASVTFELSHTRARRNGDIACCYRLRDVVPVVVS